MSFIVRARINVILRMGYEYMGQVFLPPFSLACIWRTSRLYICFKCSAYMVIGNGWHIRNTRKRCSILMQIWRQRCQTPSMVSGQSHCLDLFDGCSNHGWHRLMQCPDILMIIKHSIFTVNKNSQSFLVIYVQSSVNYFKINNCHFCLFIFQKRPIEKQR